MALTGRFNLRKTFTGRIILQVEEEVQSVWSRLAGKNKLRRRWRDATMMDLAAPELRGLVDMRFRPRYMPQAYEAAEAQKASSQVEASSAQIMHYDPYSEDARLPH